MTNFRTVYLKTVAALLFLTALAKLLSITGSQGILRVTDPLIPIHYRTLLLISSALELVIALFLLVGRNPIRKLLVVNMLSLVFLVYHLGINFLGKDETTYCPCLGHLPDQLHVSPSAALFIVEILITYMFLGSSFLLISSVFQHRQYQLPGKAVLP